MSSFNAKTISRAANWSPITAAPRAAKAFRSFSTDGASTTSMGSRPFPQKLLKIRSMTFCWSIAVSLSTKILETRWPVVPEEVMVLNTAPRSTLKRSNSLNSRTGKKGMSAGVLTFDSS